MKTKTINVWIDPVFLNENCTSVPLDKTMLFEKQYRAKIIIEIPPRKKSLDENEVMKALQSGYLGHSNDKIIEMLFGKNQ